MASTASLLAPDAFVEARVRLDRPYIIANSPGQARATRQNVMLKTPLTLAFAVILSGAVPVGAQAPSATTAPQTPAAAPRPTPPTRDPRTPGYVAATELPDRTLPPIDAEGNFIVGPTHDPAPETLVHDGVPQGTIFNLTMNSADSKIYPGIARVP